MCNPTHSLTSVYNANTTFYFKCHLQSHLKFIKNVIKITFYVYLLQHTSASRGYHQVTVNRLKSLQCMDSHVNIFTCYYCLSSYLRMYTHTFLMLHVEAFTLRFFVCSFPRTSMCPL
jgi:uncharacterized protein (DUF486 family)